MLGVKKRRMPPHERCREPTRLTESPRHVDRLGRELAGEAGRIGDAARTKLGIGEDVASAAATTQEMAEAVSAFQFPDDVWSKVIYDLVVTARNPTHPLETLVAALVPIYFGRVGSFVIENRNVTTEEAEDRVERQARTFERTKPYLVERWSAAKALESAPESEVSP